MIIMSLSTTSSGHAYYLYTSPTFTLPRSIQNSSTIKLFSSRNIPHLTASASHTLLPRSFLFSVKASPELGSQASKQEREAEAEAEEPYEEYEVEIEQPYGLKFAKGRDGGTYIDAIAPGGSADKTAKFTVGDKVIATRLGVPI